MHRKSWTLVAKPYPKGVAEAVGRCMAAAIGKFELSRDFDPAQCARTGHRRIGEAKNPGPTRTVPDRSRATHAAVSG